MRWLEYSSRIRIRRICASFVTVAQLGCEAAGAWSAKRFINWPCLLSDALGNEVWINEPCGDTMVMERPASRDRPRRRALSIGSGGLDRTCRSPDTDRQIFTLNRNGIDNKWTPAAREL